MTALAGRVAVVTGGASGIGRATVLRFLEAGARVVFGDLNEPNSEALVAEVGNPAVLRYLPADVCVESDVASVNRSCNVRRTLASSLLIGCVSLKRRKIRRRRSLLAPRLFI